MSRGSFLALSIFVMLVITSSSMINATYALNLPEEKKFVILIDEYHGGILHAKDFLTGFRSLNKSLPLVVRELNKEIGIKELSEVDLLIIPPKSSGKVYTDTEREIISDYLSNGGSLLVLGSPDSQVDLGSLNSLLNDIVIGKNSLGDQFEFYLINNKGIRLYDLFSPTGNSSVIMINVTKQEKISRIIGENVSNIAVESVAINVYLSNITTMKATETTYGVDRNGDYHFTNSTPNIAAFREYRNNARVAIMGFAESLTNKTSPLGKPWIELYDNIHFFVESIKWLLKPELYKPENIVRPVGLYTYFIILAAAITPIAFALDIIEKKSEQKKKEKEAQVKISEVLKKMREEKKKDKK
ncbi:MAG: hypothetical protein ACP6IP_08525 [Candidatus Njordarchaeia archaeon]